MVHRVVVNKLVLVAHRQVLIKRSCWIIDWFLLFIELFQWVIEWSCWLIDESCLIIWLYKPP